LRGTRNTPGRLKFTVRLLSDCRCSSANTGKVDDVTSRWRTGDDVRRRALDDTFSHAMPHASLASNISYITMPDGP